MSSVDKLTESSDLLVSFAKLLGKTLLLKVLKSSSFTSKFGIICFYETEEVCEEMKVYKEKLERFLIWINTFSS